MTNGSREAGAGTRVPTVSKYDTVITSGQATLKALLILNGAAAIAFLGFMGSSVQRIQMNPSIAGHFSGALRGFMFGAFAAVLSSGAIFLCNCFSYVEWQKTSWLFFCITCVAGAAAFGYFIYGGLQASEGFSEAASLLNVAK